MRVMMQETEKEFREVKSRFKQALEREDINGAQSMLSYYRLIIRDAIKRGYILTTQRADYQNMKKDFKELERRAC